MTILPSTTEWSMIMATHTYLVFGDLHGRILPAFRLAIAWSRDHDIPVTGLLQVGDLGYFPDLSRLDKATVRFAARDPNELGAQLVIEPNPLADSVFHDPLCPGGLWFTPGNHEDYDDLNHRASAHFSDASFPVDAYMMVRCIQNGQVETLPGGLRVGAIWGVDGEGPTARRKLPPSAYISTQKVNQLTGQSFDVLLTHDSPFDAVRPGYGSEALTRLRHLTTPPFAFFGHYHGTIGEIAPTEGVSSGRLFHMSGLELSGRDGTAEPHTVGVLHWDGARGEFEYLPEEWLRTFTRFNWQYR